MKRVLVNAITLVGWLVGLFIVLLGIDGFHLAIMENFVTLLTSSYFEQPTINFFEELILLYARELSLLC